MSLMTHRPLGNSGLVVSTLGVGCNSFGARTDADEVRTIVDEAIEAGVTFFDTADTYSRGVSEQLLGDALQGRREQVVIATKFGMDVGGLNGPDFGARASRRYIRTAVEGSLRRLGTDYIDLYQLHKLDGITPIAETLDALSDLVREGKVRYLGSSNFAAWQVADADWTASASGFQRFVTAQNEYSLYNRSAEAELLPACEALGVSVLPYFPLAYGLLTGKYRRGEKAPSGSRLEQQHERLSGADFDKVEALETFAADRGVSVLAVAIGGLAAQPAVGSVICGVSRSGQVEANATAAGWQPTPEDLDELDRLIPRGSGHGYRTFA